MQIGGGGNRRAARPGAGDLYVGMRIPVDHLRRTRPRCRVNDLDLAEIERGSGHTRLGHPAFQPCAVGGVDIFGQVTIGRGHRQGPVLAVMGHILVNDDIGAVGRLPILRLAKNFDKL
jgi:hypothetical protein